MSVLPPLSLYIHLPWCVAKCPYCDFNSYTLHGELPEAAYIDALLADLAVQRSAIGQRAIVSVFFGGGTPSLFSAAGMRRLLTALRAELTFAGHAEVTLEA
ncbi:MAG: radical SAM protein, partial [Steroidobacteraceae bacterium]